MNTAAPARPVARWHGGKWRLAPWIISHLPPHRVYVEPYCGAASVLLRKPRSHTEVLNDANGRLVNAFRVIRDRGEELSNLLRLTPYADAEYRDCREASPDPLEDARRMLVLGHQGHGSAGCAGNKKGGWRRGGLRGWPDASAEWRDLWTQVERWADRLRGVYLENGDALDVIRRWDAPGVVIYVDPPYLGETRPESIRGCAYGPHEMGSDEDHVAMAEVLRGCRGAVVLSGYRSALYDELFAGWERVERTAWADRGAERTECLWLSPRALARGLFGEV